MSIDKNVLLKSLAINSILLVLLSGASLFMAWRAQNFEDLVFTTLMMYLGAAFVIGNVLAGIIQVFRKREAAVHFVVAGLVILICGVLFLIGWLVI